MDRIRVVGTGVTIAAIAALVASVPWLTAGESSEASFQGLPAGVTTDMITAGGELFRTDALCHACHGVDGKGIPSLGADLTDSEWTHIDGSYAAIVSLVDKGVTAEASSSGIPMPPRAGANLSDDQVNSVAGYVWSISRSQ